MTENSQGGNTRTSSSGRTGCKHWLTETRQALQQDHDFYLKHETRWSWARLGIFAAGVLAVVLLRQNLVWALVAAVPFLIAFFAAVLRHLDWQDKRQCAAHRLTIVDESIYDPVEQGKPVRAWRRPVNAAHEAAALPGILESGPCWSITDQERDDLDLFSPPVGLFGLLNRSSTDLGGRRLRDFLDAPLLLPEPIRQRQQAVAWLSSFHEQRTRIMASVLPLRKQTEHLDQLVQCLQQTEPNARVVASKCIRIGSCVTGILGTYMLVQILQFNFSWIGPFILLVCFNSVIAWLFGSMLSQVKDSMSLYVPLTFTLRCLLEHAERASQALPEETQLSVLKDCFSKLVRQGRIPSLCQYLEFASLGGMVRGLLNTLMFYDLHVGEGVLSRVVAQRDTLFQGLSALAELEALNSLACFSAEQALACVPQLDAHPGLSIQEGQHPLVPDRENVPNSIQLTSETRTWVVTGPNAAGKSTFLRMVGVNCLLAQIGAAVTAQAMHFSPVRLMTDVRVRDDLAKHESYFLSEVRRLRRIIRDVQVSPPILAFIDEPFRGTNSQERTAAGVALLEHLLASGHLVLVATHEERLAQCAARHSDAENFHFQEQLIDAGIKFDYCLRPGPAHTKTAIRILEQEGYPGSFLERARGLMTDS
jgi:ABC-type molybdenum transport system ATPase subunit/photorepair protein PhrA